MKFKSNIELQAGLEDASGSLGTINQLLSSTATGTAWVDPSTIPSAASTLVVIACKNTSGAAIAQGTPVYQTGTVGATSTIEIAPADALISANKLPAIGLLQTDLNNNGFGNVVITGELTNFTTDPIDGLTPTTGDKIFVKSGGGLTLTKPTGEGNGIQNMGLVGKVSGGNAGSVTVSSIMRTNDVPNLPEGRIWIGDGNTIVSDTVYVDEPNNRVGIGTTSPNKLLDVSSDNTPTIRITNTLQSSSNYTAGAFEFYSEDVSTPGGARVLSSILCVNNAGSAVPNGNLAFYTALGGGSGAAATEKMRIDSSGNVGIGTTSPSEKLEVVGNIELSGNIKDSASSSYYIDLNGTSQLNHLKCISTLSFGNFTAGVQGTIFEGYSTHSVVRTDSARLDFYSGQTGGVGTMMSLKANGNVGIGTTSPNVPLEVKGNVRITRGSPHQTTYQQIEIGDVSTIFNGQDPDGWMSYLFNSNNTTRLFINGNTGAIQFNNYDSTNQTGTPTYLLGTDASGNIVKTNTIPGSAAGPYLPLTGGSSYPLTGDLYVGTSTASTDRFVRTYHSDNSYTEMRGYGIITNRTGSYYRPANDKTQVLAIGNDGNTWNYVSQNANYHTFSKDTSEWMRIDSSGNVGIGTTAPAYKLDVAGTGRFTDNLRVQKSANPTLELFDSTHSVVSIIGDSGTFNVSNQSVGSVIFAKYDGNVGIGTTNPAYKLDVSGTIRATGTVTAPTFSGALSGNATTVSSITANTGLLYDKLRAPANIDGLTTTNFRTTLFGAATSGPQISAGRWNTTPSVLSGMSSYGTMLSWANSDTQGFIATEYSAPGRIRVGGGNGNSINFVHELISDSSLHQIKNGIFESSTSLRAPIFYDSNNTGYYVDPASQSYMSTINFGGILNGNGHATIGRNHAYDTLELRGYGSEMMIGSQGTALHINYRTCNSGAASNTPTDWYWRAGSSSSYSNHYMGNIHAATSSRAPIFYDSNNTGYYLNPASLSTLGDLTVNHFGISNTSGTSKDGISLYGGAQAGEPTYGLMFSGTAGSGTHGAVTSDWATYFTMSNHSSRGWIFRKAGVSNSASISASGVATFDTSVNSPIFYDSNNTGYYTDPASNSHFNTITTAGTVRVGSGFYVGDPSDTSTDIYMEDGDEGQRRIHCNSNRIGFLTSSNGWGSYCTDNGDWTTDFISYAGASMRAPLFYDNNNTGYYIDGASTSSLNSLNVNALDIGGGNIAVDTTNGFVNSGPWTRNQTPYGYIDFGPANAGTAHIYTDRPSFYFNKTVLVLGGSQINQSDIRASIFYDVDNTGYYLNPNSTSNLNTVTAAQFNGPLSGNASTATTATQSNAVNLTGYGNNNFTVYQTSGTFAGYSGWANYFIGNHGNGSNYYNTIHIMPFWSAPKYSRLEGGAQTAVYDYWTSEGVINSDHAVNAPIFYDSNNTGYYVDPASTSNVNVITAAGTMTATNFILSSDERKKTKIKDLSCDNIDISWKSFEMKSDEGEYRVGVIAQELEVKHPEFVNTDSEGFKSVKYIDLLISKIAELEARLEKAGI